VVGFGGGFFSCFLTVMREEKYMLYMYMTNIIGTFYDDGTCDESVQ
jgi:hypothetical protein